MKPLDILTALDAAGDKATQGEWRVVVDAQGPNMVMHPSRHGIAIASLTSAFSPACGFHEDWGANDGKSPATISERNGNAEFLLLAANARPALKQHLAAVRKLVEAARELVDRDPCYCTTGYLCRACAARAALKEVDRDER